MNWVELFGSREYDFPTEVEPGSRFVGGTAYPDAIVVEAAIQYPQRILVQTMNLDVSDDNGRREKIRVMRVVAELPPHELVELSRTAVKIEDDGEVDVSWCSGCGAAIVKGQHIIIGGAAYHRRCVTESEGERNAHRSRGHSGGDRGRSNCGAGGNGGCGTEAEGARVPRTSPEKTVTRAHSDDGVSISHAVTVSRFDSDTDLVTLWAREFGGRSGTVKGRWPDGFCGGDVPQRHEVAYIAEKFFGGERMATGADIVIWSRLYTEALTEAGRPRAV